MGDDYALYADSATLARALADDVAVRFSLRAGRDAFPQAVAEAVVGYVNHVAEARNLARFS